MEVGGIDLSAFVGRQIVAIGFDLVDIDRMRAIIDRRAGFVDRVFTAQEQAYAYSAVDPAERFAARFAAKEAVLKVLGTGLGGAAFTDIEVTRLATGQPELHVRGKGAQLAADLGIDHWLVTLTHSNLTAGAVAAGVQETSG